jgi:hypothetical protein
LKRCQVRYSPAFRPGPMTIWVHRRYAPGPAPVPDGVPPLPGPVGGKGFATLEVEFDGLSFIFASRHELDAFRAAMGQRVLPRPQALDRDLVPTYANSHWLSRLPAGAKSWRYRERLVRWLQDRPLPW